jgi:hypothetical protein
MLRPKLLVPAVLAVALAGCGQSSSATNFAGAEQGVAEQVEELEAASESRDGDRACSEILSSALRTAMRADGRSCAQEVEEAMQDADDSALDVREVTVTGDRATAVVTARIDGADRRRTLELVREGNAWRIDSLGG